MEPSSMSGKDYELSEELYQLIAQAARSNAPVLIQDESGSGKEIVARLLHGQSRRAGGPFIVIHCDPMRRKLLEREVFGSGTDSSIDAAGVTPGLLAAANGGTLFFDELHDLSGPMQIGLLRFLDRGEYRPVGSKRPLHADIRIVGATNQDLQALVLQGRFSDDLLYRISTITLRLLRLSARVANQNFQG
jgi:DNA-binding NtrC family response regulator